MVYLISINYNLLLSVDLAFCESYTCINVDVSPGMPQYNSLTLLHLEILNRVKSWPAGLAVPGSRTAD